MWHVFADVKMPADLKLPVPAIAPRVSDGRREPEIVVLDPTPELSDYIAKLSDRAEKAASRAVPTYEDNMLLISGDGRKAALDMRLLDTESLPTGPVKLDAVANQILKTWENHQPPICARWSGWHQSRTPRPVIHRVGSVAV